MQNQNRFKTNQEDLTPIREHLRDELTPDRHERGKYICPFCGSGEGRNKTGAFSIMPDGIHGQCFSCSRIGDIFDVVAAKEGISLSEATKRLIDRYGTGRRLSAIDRAKADFLEPEDESRHPAPQHDYSDYINARHAALPGSDGLDYLRSRGFNDQTIERFKLGFDPAHYFPGRGTFPAVVFSYDPIGSYVGWRAITEKHYDKPKTAEAGEEPAFNAAALWQDKPCFVVESQLCAISIMQCGGTAVAIGGTGKRKILPQGRIPSALLILCLDNDDAGRSAQTELAADLRANGVPFIEYNVAGDCKDPNELLQEDPEALRRNVEEGIRLSENQADHERSEYMAQTTGGGVDEFRKYIASAADNPPIPTGFRSLDRILNGGLCPGLYIMGAISSLGKTSWMLNVADNIAAAGHDVLYFSLEMSKYELMSKSISRLSFEAISRHQLPIGEAFNTFDVMNSGRYQDSMSDTKRGILGEAFEMYMSGIGEHLWIIEGVGSFGVDDITQRVREHIRITGKKPVVFVDYLQILSPADARATDKQNTDRAVLELKRLSRSEEIPVFCISSLNRENYKEVITTSAFKESGAIEYGSDVLIGMQLWDMGYRDGEKPNTRAERIAKLITAAEQSDSINLQIRVLKNRNGRRGDCDKLTFTKAYNSFAEDTGFTKVDNDVVSGIFVDD